MANTNTTKKATKTTSAKATETKTKKAEVADAKAEETNTTVNNGPSYDELLQIIQQLSGEVSSLKAKQNASPAVVANTTTDDKTDRLLDILANRKSDKEITIVHNCELLGGLSTHLDLTGMTIDFRSHGEQRVLSWQQFEECVSKYRRFFEKQLILLSNEHEEIAQRYNIPCVKRGDKHILTHKEIVGLNKLSVPKLTEFVESLTDEDRSFVFSYWIGKCYEKAEGYYDRHKIETLNHLSGTHVFDNVLTLMNGDFYQDDKKNK